MISKFEKTFINFLDDIPAAYSAPPQIKIEWIANEEEGRIIEYFIGNQLIEEFNHPIWDELQEWLIEKFDLPKYGIGHHTGTGIIYKNEEDRVIIKYSSVYYFGEESSIQEIELKEPIAISYNTNSELSKIFGVLDSASYEFYGAYHINLEKERWAEFSAMVSMYPQYEEPINNLLDKIENAIHSNIQLNIQHGSVNYVAHHEPGTISIISLTIYEHSVRKDVDRESLLFEE